MQKYIDPLSDFGFKKIFGNEQSKDLLMSFLNDLLDLEYEIVDLTFENVERQGKTDIFRKSIYDVRCVDSNNTIFIVELQKIDQDFFKERMLYYTSTVIVDQDAKGKKWKFKIPKIYSIGITDFPVFSDLKHIHKGQILDIEDHHVLIETPMIIFVELPKFTKKINELESHLDKWLYFIRHLTEDESLYDLFKHDPAFKKGFELANTATLSKSEWSQYQAYFKEESIKLAELQSAEKKGELNKALETAKNFLSMGLSIEQVCQGTGLTLEQLKEHHII